MSLLNRPRAESIMSEHHLDVLVATTVENVAYVSGFSARTLHTMRDSLAIAILPREDVKSGILVLPIMNAAELLDEPSQISDVRFYGNFAVARSTVALEGFEADLAQIVSEGGRYQSGIQALIEILLERGWARCRIGLDEMGVSPRMWEAVRLALPAAELVWAHDTFRRIRAVKTSEEIRRLELSARIAEAAIGRSMEAAKVGVSEHALLQVYLETVGRSGATPGCFYINAGRRTGMALLPSRDDYTLRSGDCVKYDVGCVRDLYWSDTGRTAVVGKPSKKIKTYYNAMREGQQAIVAAVRPGVGVSELFHLGVNTVRKAGIPHFNRPHCGHGIGLEFYDHPLLKPTAEEAGDVMLEESMVVNVECPYYEIGFAGFQLEDTVLVTASGFRYLTNAPRDLRVV